MHATQQHGARNAQRKKKSRIQNLSNILSLYHTLDKLNDEDVLEKLQNMATHVIEVYETQFGESTLKNKTLKALLFWGSNKMQ